MSENTDRLHWLAAWLFRLRGMQPAFMVNDDGEYVVGGGKSVV